MTFRVNELTKNSILESLPWQEYVDNPFVDTVWKPYLALHPMRKGAAGEAYVKAILENLGHRVEKRTNTGHDLIVDAFKLEIKFSLATKGKKDCFTWNHLACEKDYDRALLVGINVDGEDRWKWFDRQDFCDNWQEGFSHQQGGAKANNDDYMMLGSATSLLELPWIHDFSNWKAH